MVAPGSARRTALGSFQEASNSVRQAVFGNGQGKLNRGSADDALEQELELHPPCSPLAVLLSLPSSANL